MATQLEIILWKSHPKWEVNCGQHMKVKCSPTGKKKKRQIKQIFREQGRKKVGKLLIQFIMIVPYLCGWRFCPDNLLHLWLINISIFISITSFNPQNNLKNEAKNKLPPPNYRYVICSSGLLNGLSKVLCGWSVVHDH